MRFLVMPNGSVVRTEFTTVAGAQDGLACFVADSERAMLGEFCAAEG
jgi:hypothetical protein